MTAAGYNPSQDHPSCAAHSTADGAAARIGLTCHTAAGGRRATRALAQWAQRFQLSEPDFQLLWCLRPLASAGLDQTTLARRLVYSPAQISATVERLRAAALIQQRQAPGDRRRNLWQLSESGRRLLNEMLAAAGFLQFEFAAGIEPIAEHHERKEAA